MQVTKEFVGTYYGQDTIKDNPIQTFCWSQTATIK